jgi:hypothetical protein
MASPLPRGAGHKTVSADAGLPTCVVVKQSRTTPLPPSEEQLPIRINGSSTPVGESLYLLPRHIRPTVNNFDSALLVRHGRVAALEKVSARGRGGPLLRLFGSFDQNWRPDVSQKGLMTSCPF